MNAGEIKVMIVERAREQTINFAKPYRVGSKAILGCKIWSGMEKMEEVNEFKYLGTILRKHGSMEGEIKERTVKGRQVMGALERVMKGRNVSMEVKWGIRNSVILPILSYALETWTWNTAEQSRIRAVEMSYLRGACDVSRLDRESNEDTYGRFGMSETAVGMDYGVVEWVNRSTLRCYGHLMRMNECDFTKTVYESTIEGRGVRGRPPVEWINRVEENWRERERERESRWERSGMCWERVPEQGDLETTLPWPPSCVEVPVRGRGVGDIER